ncbi:MAG: hypothetical protein HONBIEJF_02251 [Fimbriimonadaceae bacterium]|nr:hypothetical protein [Fimbriimonadaceae bacterium]
MDQPAERPELDGIAPSPESEAPKLPEAPDPATLERAERLLREARLARQRGQADLCRKLLTEAKEIAPGAGVVWEAIGDDAVANHQSRLARESYTMAWKLSPKDPNIERKYAETVLSSAVFMDPKMAAAAANPRASVWLSVILPGLGQMANEDYGKGSIMMGAWTVALIISTAIPDGLGALLSFKLQSLNLIAVVPMLVMLAIHIWSIYDASQNTVADRGRKIPERPVPPVDKPFEL